MEVMQLRGRWWVTGRVEDGQPLEADGPGQRDVGHPRGEDLQQHRNERRWKAVKGSERSSWTWRSESARLSIVMPCSENTRQRQ